MLILCFSTLTFSDERLDHFKGIPADTLEQAVTNFSEYNNKLAEILAKDNLSPKELHSVHELTYTLENALEKINVEFIELAKILETVHVASETGDAKTVKNQGTLYLNTALQIIK